MTRSQSKPAPGMAALAAAAEALAATAAALDPAALDAACALLVARIRRGGRLHLAGVGKAGFVAARAAATLSSWGIPAHPLDVLGAVHGDLGQVGPSDACLAVSKSGETTELVDLCGLLARRRIPVIAVTGGAGSRLARAARVVLAHPEMKEGGPWDLAPMASLAAEAALLDAVAAELASRLSRRPADFAANHPGGTLGRKASRLARR